MSTLHMVAAVASLVPRNVRPLPQVSGLRRLKSTGAKFLVSSELSKVSVNMPKSWLSKLGFGSNNRTAHTDSYSLAHEQDDDKPAVGQQFATFGAGCFWGVELAFQRIPGVTKTEVGYSQGVLHNPTYSDVCEGDTQHSEVVRVQFDPNQCTYENLLDVFWMRHDPTTLNRQKFM